MRLTHVVGGAILLFSLLYLCIVVLYSGSKWRVVPSAYSPRSSRGGFFKQKSWDGLPVSVENFLYVKVDNDTFNMAWELEQKLVGIDFSDHSNPQWISLFDLYLPKVGFNGIMNALKEGINLVLFLRSI
mgnify:CR=1 FL=1